ncbi:ribosomal protein S18-alanine N-acetyltransferase [Weissella soli]|uniref:[Ribosomal protein bS18]-alanine N-acetyltransferase n=1 Tax=Weissella soli TaxID=155866 RepID=A0A288QKV6_9LACO|nr:ribosomal protein S18-alanine N-acetyltransferase [Weissella soli]AOT55746.1 Ribosomal-protein-alanine N-acetyltransferase [Weissella soli]MCT8394382.1 ribosomal-protein-alanine N-acetyltransferase [Weissella soli]NKY83559.1 ribosomal protein S18-alanine N-acetyltransferase [Weissella soli]QEA35319.1 ribosomal-protein-alanine N-acetyltransferase [Weissella soli]RDL06580.1 ribosomal-protein-alanine N-acetyltransferase [Weissella soli]
MELNYRETTTADEIYTIAKAAYKGSPWTKQLFKNDLRSRLVRYLVLEVDHEPAGFVGGTLVADELSISNVAIVPKFQGAHLGEKLLLKWFEQFEAGTRVLLEVRYGNQRAMRLYERMGFQVYNIREDYYRDPVEDAYLMDLTLGEKELS